MTTSIKLENTLHTVLLSDDQAIATCNITEKFAKLLHPLWDTICIPVSLPYG